jgi:hypothetical protein
MAGRAIVFLMVGVLISGKNMDRVFLETKHGGKYFDQQE